MADKESTMRAGRGHLDNESSTSDTGSSNKTKDNVKIDAHNKICGCNP